MSDHFIADQTERRAEWHRYYSAKRITHQWLQVHLLADLAVETVLEVGPYLGVVSAMLDNAGYRVTSLDRLPRQHDNDRVSHIVRSLEEVTTSDLNGFDCIICCETLEHLPWDDVGRYLALFRAAQPRHVIISVPFEGFQFDLSLYVNWRTWRRAFALKKFRGLRKFDPPSDPYGHKWEVGYRGYGLKALESKLIAAGFRIRRREFSSPTRSVFYLLDAALPHEERNER